MGTSEDGWESAQLADRKDREPSDASDSKLMSVEERGVVSGCRDAGIAGWFKGLSRQYGHKLLVLLFLTQHLIKGFSATLVWKASPFLLRSYSVPAQSVQILSIAYNIPWVIKPIVGLISDVCPINGYNKGPYMFCTCIIGAVCSLVVGLTPHSMLSVHALVFCLGGIMMEVATTDLMTEALYAERMQASPESAPDLLTYVFIGATVLGLVAQLTSGFMIEFLGAPSLILVTFIPAILVGIYLAMGCMDEKKTSWAKAAAVRQRFWDQKECCMLTLVMFAGTLSMGGTAALSDDPAMNAAVSLAVAGTVAFSFSLVLAPMIAKFSAFSLIQASLSLSVSSPSFYFMTDTVPEYADGPHFSALFYSTVMGSVGGVCSLVGLITYNRYSKRCAYRNLLVGTNIVLCMAHLSDALIFSRLNLWLGIPDYIFALGSDVLGSIVGQWQWMPQMALFSMLCPKGMEATMFALIVGCHNMGISIASNLGALLLKALSCNPQGAKNEEVQFANLWKASVTASLLPLISIMLLSTLIPHARQDESLQVKDATTGSLWRRWTGSRKEDGLADTDDDAGSASPDSDTAEASFSSIFSASS